MPFAKGVSAKSHDFDAEGNETKTDYRRMMKIVLDAGYHGYVGIEYEGGKLPSPRAFGPRRSCWNGPRRIAGLKSHLTGRLIHAVE